MMIRTFIAAAALLGAACAQASGLEQLNAFLAGAHTAQGSFAQVVTAKSGRKPQQSSGSFALQRPGKFRWIYDKPYPQTLVSDGDKFWSFDPDLNQVTVRKLGKALGSSPAALLAGDGLDKNFDLKDSGSENGVEYVDATPKAQDASFQRVRIGLVANVPQTMEIHDNFGQTTVLRFTRFQMNPALNANLFHFTPPKGADVVGE
ncbi:MAG TPA: outer membrane lipoprotein chaperone LolA [Rhodocyclaceae bacterium]|jgi:outer membrane lipoprotein carrier protein